MELEHLRIFVYVKGPGINPADTDRGVHKRRIYYAGIGSHGHEAKNL